LSTSERQCKNRRIALCSPVKQVNGNSFSTTKMRRRTAIEFRAPAARAQLAHEGGLHRRAHARRAACATRKRPANFDATEPDARAIRALAPLNAKHVRHQLATRAIPFSTRARVAARNAHFWLACFQHARCSQNNAFARVAPPAHSQHVATHRSPLHCLPRAKCAPAFVAMRPHRCSRIQATASTKDDRIMGMSKTDAVRLLQRVLREHIFDGRKSYRQA